ncbi:MAG: hypothetical protein CMF74_01110 [Maricaulis sp.]|jgi:outer membrane protein TolC|nr:hypothetical protein [Maricaulis sp.]
MTLSKLFSRLTVLAVAMMVSACAPILAGRDAAPLAVAPESAVILPANANLDQIAALAVINNRELRALRAQEGVANAQVFAAGLLPDPTVSFGADFPLNATGAVTGVSGSLGMDLLALMRRPHEQAAAEAARDAIRDDIVWAEWLTAEQARLLAVRIDRLRTLQELTGRLRVLTQDQLQRALSAAGRGDLPGSGLESYRLAAADAIDRNQAVELRLSAAEFALNRLLDQPPGRVIRFAVDQGDGAEPADPALLFTHARETRIDLQALRAGLNRQDDIIAASLLARYPIPVIDIHAARDTGNLTSVGPGLSFTLPLWNRGQGETAIARATRVQLDAEYQARVTGLEADIYAAADALRIARSQRDQTRSMIAPLTGQAEASAVAAARGDISNSAALATRVTLLDRQISEVELALAAEEYRIALEVLTGSALEGLQ